ncbi:hypothetical protein [Micromonospora cathayae]|uniref:Uncharacterized protein n=1 Tax=Micromonospora cathayae TaxID=3028804 RepID=A0ABY7ZXG1_9ACTN|nr:hypothetical protein [Micromonospora sp. HUAS 3]WDZ87770.1 hypothetical protein PVK37_15860 [Micromonospora sp. HUAS 3]
MPRRLVVLAPLLAWAILLHVGLVCRVPLAATAGPPPASAPAGVPAFTSVPYRAVSALAGPDGQRPKPIVTTGFDAKACGSVARSGRGNQGTDRRSPVPQLGPTPPDGAIRRSTSTVDGGASVGDGARPVRLSVLRC